MPRDQVKKGTPIYEAEAEDALLSIYEIDLEHLPRHTKLLAALSLVREARKGLRPGADRCGSCERITYEDWEARKLQQIYNGLVSRLRNAVRETLETHAGASRPEELEFPGDSL